MKDKILRAVVVEDEDLAREDFIRLLNNFDSIEFAGEASNLQEAINVCASVIPDIVFLDIQLANESGFELLEHLDPKTKVIFVTAYDEYAVKAFEVGVYDYLLKPVTLERLNLAIEKFSQIDSQNERDEKSLSYEDNIFLKIDTKYQFVKVSSIKYISSADDYSEIKIVGSSRGKLTSKSLREWEERLPENQFCRIHRFTIVNLEYISNIEPWHNNSHRVYIRDEDKPLLMSRRYFAIIKNKLG